MEIREIYLPEFEQEMKKTREILERVPEDKPDFKPHEKSMPLGRLAAHIAQLPEFGTMIIELPSLDFSTGNMKPLVMESRQQLLAAFKPMRRRPARPSRARRMKTGNTSGSSAFKEKPLPRTSASWSIAACSSITRYITAASLACISG